MANVDFKPVTLILIRRDNQLLLGLKKRGFGQGKWNGFGGKLNAGETILQAATRELQEEVGVSCAQLKLVGRLEFYQPHPPHLLMYIFAGSGIKGDPHETEEMRPEWFAIDALPHAEMWPDDEYWMPLFLAGKRFCGHFTFDQNDRVINYQLAEATTDDMLR